MSWPWSELMLPGPAELPAIRHAYAQRLKETHPEEDPEGFQQLHSAYRAACRLAKFAAQGESEDVSAPQRAVEPPKAPSADDEKDAHYDRIFTELEQKCADALRVERESAQMLEQKRADALQAKRESKQRQLQKKSERKEKFFRCFGKFAPKLERAVIRFQLQWVWFARLGVLLLVLLIVLMSFASYFSSKPESPRKNLSDQDILLSFLEQDLQEDFTVLSTRQYGKETLYSLLSAAEPGLVFEAALNNISMAREKYWTNYPGKLLQSRLQGQASTLGFALSVLSRADDTPDVQAYRQVPTQGIYGLEIPPSGKDEEVSQLVGWINDLLLQPAFQNAPPDAIIHLTCLDQTLYEFDFSKHTVFDADEIKDIYDTSAVPTYAVAALREIGKQDNGLNPEGVLKVLGKHELDGETFFALSGYKKSHLQYPSMLYYVSKDGTRIYCLPMPQPSGVAVDPETGALTSLAGFSLEERHPLSNGESIWVYQWTDP